MKTCPKCGIEKPGAEFPGCKKNKGGLYSYCKQCVCKASTAYYHRLTPEEKTERQRRNFESNKRWERANPAQIKYSQKWARAKHKYGLTKEQIVGMLADQGGECALCRQEIGFFGGVERANIDHCHLTGVVRALLCGHCNTNLGRFQDSPELLRRAAAYLEKYSKPKT